MKKITKKFKKTFKHKLLLDEGLPPRTRYPQINSYHDVKHAAHDYRMNASSDNDIYKRATKENRIVVVFNTKHFLPLLKSESASIFAISPRMEDRSVDSIVRRLLTTIRQKDSKGKIYFISNSGIRIQNVE